jgi:hypothetical protein
MRTKDINNAKRMTIIAIVEVITILSLAICSVMAPCHVCICVGTQLILEETLPVLSAITAGTVI